jgi:hypothetical protein
VPYAVGVALVPTALPWSAAALFPPGDGPPLDPAALTGTLVCAAAGTALLAALLRGARIARPVVAAGFLTAAGLAAWLQTAVTDHLAAVPWSLGTAVAAALNAAVVAAVVAVVLAAARERTRPPRLVVCALVALVGLVLLRAAAEAAIGAQVHERTLRATEAAYAAFPHDIAVLDAPGWEAVGTRVTEAGHAFTIAYEDGSGARLALTSAPAESFPGGRADPLRHGCGTGRATCEETRGVVLLDSHSPSADEPALARMELAPGFYAQLATAPRPTPASTDDLLRLSERVRIDQDGDREALARDVVEHHEW